MADWVDRRCVGNSGSALRVGYRQLCLHDSTLGVASTDNITVFPPGITTGATWDKDLMYKRGVALGDEFRCKGINVYLGPTIGPLGRKVLGGRSWESFGADPVLQGHAAAATIKGVQEQGVIATAKHLIGNEQEMFRQYNPVQPAYSANIGSWPCRDMQERLLTQPQTTGPCTSFTFGRFPTPSTPALALSCVLTMP